MKIINVIWAVIRWFFGLTLCLISIVGLVSGVIGMALVLVLGILFLPPVTKFLLKKKAKHGNKMQVQHSIPELDKKNRLAEIQTQIRNLNGFETFLGRKEIKELPNILCADEVVENIIQGNYNDGIGILVATNRRLVFVDKRIFGLKVEDFAYDKISSIQYETGMFFGTLTLFTSGNKAIIHNVLKSKVCDFGNWVRERISAPKENTIQQPTTTQIISKENVNIVDQLEKLAKLKEQGVLTEEEFASQKEKILGL